jgi:O-acetyl-ADP-ribose deacetylase (regulator of RNase III)
MSPRATVHGVVIEVAEGDITRQPDIDAVVNAANAELIPGGGSRARSTVRQARPGRRVRAARADPAGGSA